MSFWRLPRIQDQVQCCHSLVYLETHAEAWWRLAMMLKWLNTLMCGFDVTVQSLNTKWGVHCVDTRCKNLLKRNNQLIELVKMDTRGATARGVSTILTKSLKTAGDFSLEGEWKRDKQTATKTGRHMGGKKGRKLTRGRLGHWGQMEARQQTG